MLRCDLPNKNRFGFVDDNIAIVLRSMLSLSKSWALSGHVQCLRFREMQMILKLGSPCVVNTALAKYLTYCMFVRLSWKLEGLIKLFPRGSWGLFSLVLRCHTFESSLILGFVVSTQLFFRLIHRTRQSCLAHGRFRSVPFS